MALLPSGLVVPPLPYLVALVVLTAAVAVFLVSLQPRFDQRLVFGLVPWMVAGATAHVFYQIDQYPTAPDVYPELLEPLAAAPAVYVTTFVLAGLCWTALTFLGEVRASFERVALYLGWLGGIAVLALFALAGSAGALSGATPFWSLIALLVTIPLTVGVYFAMAYFAPGVVSRARLVGGLAIFAHALDGTSTTVGIDILGRGERSPLPELIMDFAGSLPTAPYLGTGWLFVLVKLAVAVGIVVVFADYLEDDPVRGNLLFTFVVALGLGPAVNNLVLFALREQTAVVAAA